MLAGLLRRLFGKASEADRVTATEDYDGFEIQATPLRESDGWRVAGRVLWRRDGEVLQYDYVRADSFPSADNATAMTLAKGRQLIDERGQGLFDDQPDP
jgi:hypothetical protein